MFDYTSLGCFKDGKDTLKELNTPDPHLSFQCQVYKENYLYAEKINSRLHACITESAFVSVRRMCNWIHILFNWTKPLSKGVCREEARCDRNSANWHVVAG